MSTSTLLEHPHHLEAERAVLGAILVDNAQMDAALAAHLTADQFFRDVHQRVFRALVTLAERRSALDFVTVRIELERTGDLEEVGPAYLASLIDGGMRGVNLPHYLALVQETYRRRQVMDAARLTLQEAAAGDLSAGDVLDAAIGRLVLLGQRADGTDLVEGHQLVTETMAYLEEVEARRRSGGVGGVPTGFRSIDGFLDGFQPGQLIILAGRTSQGKTALATQFALASESCAFFSLEMDHVDLALRELAVLGRINGWRLRRGLLTSHEQGRLSHAFEQLGEAGVAIDDTAGITVSQVRAKARRRQQTQGLRLIIVDYLQLMQAETGRRRESTREQDVAQVTRGLQAIAKDLRVPVVALSQFNRALRPDEEPTLANLRESGELEQAANVVLLLHREDGQSVAEAGQAKVIIAKHRGGPTGSVLLDWWPEETRFSDPMAAEPRQEALV